MASEDILFERFPNIAYVSFIPVGWYAAEYTVSIEDDEELVAFMESIVVYDFNSLKYDKLMDLLMKMDLVSWSDEKLDGDDLLHLVYLLAAQFFGEEEDDIDGHLYTNIVGIIRHIAQNGSKPEFLNFNERSVYDLDRFALELVHTPPLECITHLKNQFNDEGLLWKILYGNFMNFKKAFDQSMNRILFGPEDKGAIEYINPPESSTVLTEEIRQHIYKHDNYQCLCCGKERRRSISLEIDHILPIAMGGKNIPSNLQRLCKQCNGIKGVNEINYRSIVSPLSSPKEMLLFDSKSSDYIQNIISRIVNHFNHCKAFCNLEYSQRKNGKNYSTWIINLYNGNNPTWLENNVPNLLEYVRNDLGWDSVEEIIVES